MNEGVVVSVVFDEREELDDIFRVDDDVVVILNDCVVEGAGVDVVV